MLVFYGVSVLTFDSKSRRAISGPDRTPGCGWDEWQGLVLGPRERDGDERMVDGEVASDSGGIHRGAEEASSSGAGVLDRGSRDSLRVRGGDGLGLWFKFFTVKAVECRHEGRQGRQKLAPLHNYLPA